MKKPNYELKSKLLKDGNLLKEYKKCSKSIYHYVYGIETATDIPYKLALTIQYEHSRDRPKEWKECGRISNAHCKRVIRLRQRVAEMVINADCIFLTFTFTDKYLFRLQPHFRRIAVKRFLSALNAPYVANIDFGKKNGREHYHALVAVDKVDYSKWKYGAINGQKIRNDTEDTERIARYIAKLTNHAIKETTKRSVILYSRKKYVCLDRKYYELDKNGEIVKNDK